MRDDRDKWAPAIGAERPAIKNTHLQLSVLKTQRQTLISGPYKKCLDICKLPRATSWPQTATGNNYAVRLRRDRILVIDGPSLDDGWHDDAGVSVSDMSSAYILVEIKGEAALDLLNRGADLNVDIASGSVVRSFRGFDVFIYRWQSETQFRMHFHHANLEAIWQLSQAFEKQIVEYNRR
ncbi:MAG: hypothetical protein GY761_18805 [Hyphomicrobiales bacterium]|nr:hypothetical protein [Hyphomicrobiales bacterium]